MCSGKVVNENDIHLKLVANKSNRAVVQNTKPLASSMLNIVRNQFRDIWLLTSASSQSCVFLTGFSELCYVYEIVRGHTIQCAAANGPWIKWSTFCRRHIQLFSWQRFFSLICIRQEFVPNVPLNVNQYCHSMSSHNVNQKSLYSCTITMTS